MHLCNAQNQQEQLSNERTARETMQKQLSNERRARQTAEVRTVAYAVHLRVYLCCGRRLYY
jgi:hypothetical protein